MIKVSIIVPVYNTYKYLDKCLSSLTRQTLKEIEIICVNDGSTDKSLDILEKWKNLDGRIIIVDKINGGLVSARKAGVKKAIGKYVGFVDSDDYVDEDMFQKLYSITKKYDADMVSSGLIVEGNYTSYHYDYVNEGFYGPSEISSIRENVFYDIATREVGVRSSLCCKLFKRNDIAKLYVDFPIEISYAEDKMMVITYLLNCKSVYILHKCYYHYVYHNESMVHKHNVSYLRKLDAVYSYMNTLYNHPNFSENMRTQAEIYIIEQLYKGINSRMGLKNANLLWIDPYYLNELNRNDRIILYGWGDFLACYKRQLEINGFFVSGISGRIEELNANKDYDVILIAIKNKDKAESVMAELVSSGIEKKQIRWFDQTEIFWKFAKANGFI